MLFWHLKTILLSKEIRLLILWNIRIRKNLSLMLSSISWNLSKQRSGCLESNVLIWSKLNNSRSNNSLTISETPKKLNRQWKSKRIQSTILKHWWETKSHKKGNICARYVVKWSTAKEMWVFLTNMSTNAYQMIKTMKQQTEWNLKQIWKLKLDQYKRSRRKEEGQRKEEETVIWPSFCKRNDRQLKYCIIIQYSN